jgi:hypothetical protein
MRAKLYVPLIAVLAAAVLWGVPASAQQISKRLILKDGSYQSATKWEVHGDRVRYYSAERDDWEEIPNSFVDWDATNKYEEDLASGDADKTFQLHKELTEEKQADETQSPTVAPGLRLEDPHAAYLLDTFKDQPQLVQMQSNGGTVERNVKKTILHGDASGPPNGISLKGAHAEVQAHSPSASLYVNSEGGPQDDSSSASGQPGLPWDRFRIVSMDVREDKRIISKIKTPAFGKSSEQQNIVKTTNEQLTGGWIKITPVDPLPPGEYALVELLGDEGINLYVWDFGMNAQAQVNKNVVQAQPATPVSAEPPALQKR